MKALLILSLLPSLAAAVCAPPELIFNWSTPPRAAIDEEQAVRWPLDATLRLAFAGSWCPLSEELILVPLDGEEEGKPLPAQVRTLAPQALVPGSPAEVVVLEIDPEQPLEPRSDYRLRPILPDDRLMPLSRGWSLEFRTLAREMEPIPEFSGIQSVEIDLESLCGSQTPFRPQNDCREAHGLNLIVQFRPLDRPDLIYELIRSRCLSLDEEGVTGELLAEGPQLLSIQAPGRDTRGSGVPVRSINIEVPYSPLPRQECFKVLLLDEWGRVAGGEEEEACLDLQPLPPCPGPPWPSTSGELPEPTLGAICANIGLEGADPTRLPDVSPPPEDLGLVTDGGVSEDLALEPAEEANGGDDGGCQQGSVSSKLPLLLLLLPLLLFRAARLRIR